MILICGITNEKPIELIKQRAKQMKIPFTMWNQLLFRSISLRNIIEEGDIQGQLHIDNQSYYMDEYSGVYLRPVSEEIIPELKDLPLTHPLYQNYVNLHRTLYAWCEISPIPIMNRVSTMGSNSSKPYQTLIIQKHGFDTPNTLITNDPEEVLNFYETYEKVVYKSVSGVRSIVNLLKKEDMERLDSIRWCPTQFQSYVEGTDLRIHTVGTEIFGTEIVSNRIDYRYSNNGKGHTKLRKVDIPDDIGEKCIRLSSKLGLSLAGIDLRKTPEDKYICFEVNTSPAFSYYEEATGQTISKSIVHQLAGM